MGLFKEQKKHIKYKTKYITNVKMKNRNIHSKVISVKLFCREKVLRMYCTFFDLLFFLQINFYAYVHIIFSDAYFLFCETIVKYIIQNNSFLFYHQGALHTYILFNPQTYSGCMTSRSETCKLKVG